MACVHSHCLGPTAVAYRWETWKVLFIQQIKTSVWIHICIWMNSWSHNHIQDTRATIKNGTTTWGSFITADSRFYINYGCDGEEFSHRLIDLMSHRLKRYHHGGGGGLFEFSLFSSFSIGFKYPVSAVCVLLWLLISGSNSAVKQCLNKNKSANTVEPN